MSQDLFTSNKILEGQSYGVSFGNNNPVNKTKKKNDPSPKRKTVRHKKDSKGRWLTKEGKISKIQPGKQPSWLKKAKAHKKKRNVANPVNPVNKKKKRNVANPVNKRHATDSKGRWLTKDGKISKIQPGKQPHWLKKARNHKKKNVVNPKHKSSKNPRTTTLHTFYEIGGAGLSGLIAFMATKLAPMLTTFIKSSPWVHFFTEILINGIVIFVAPRISSKNSIYIILGSLLATGSDLLGFGLKKLSETGFKLGKFLNESWNVAYLSEEPVYAVLEQEEEEVIIEPAISFNETPQITTTETTNQIIPVFSDELTQLQPYFGQEPTELKNYMGDETLKPYLAGNGNGNGNGNGLKSYMSQELKLGQENKIGLKPY